MCERNVAACPKNKYFRNAFFAPATPDYTYVCIFRYILYRIFPRDQNPLGVCMPGGMHGVRTVLFTRVEKLACRRAAYFLWHLFSLTVDISFLKNEYAYSSTDPIGSIVKVRIVFVFEKIVIFKFTLPSLSFPCIRLERGTERNSGNPKRFTFVIV